MKLYYAQLKKKRENLTYYFLYQFFYDDIAHDYL